MPSKNKTSIAVSKCASSALGREKKCIHGEACHGNNSRLSSFESMVNLGPIRMLPQSQYHPLSGKQISITIWQSPDISRYSLKRWEPSCFHNSIESLEIALDTEIFRLRQHSRSRWPATWRCNFRCLPSNLSYSWAHGCSPLLSYSLLPWWISQVHRDRTEPSQEGINDGAWFQWWWFCVWFFLKSTGQATKVA